jgi:hypothetical protein
MKKKYDFITLIWMAILAMCLSGCAPTTTTVKETTEVEPSEGKVIGRYTEKSFDIKIDYQVRSTKNALIMAGTVENLLLKDTSFFELDITLSREKKGNAIAVKKLSSPGLDSNDSISFIFSFPRLNGPIHWEFNYGYTSYDDFFKRDVDESGWFDRDMIVPSP